MPNEEILDVKVEELIPFVHQSRTVFDEDELKNLGDDIKANGQLQPGVAWFDTGRGKYVLICGERRWRAIKLAGLPSMAIKVIQGNLAPGQMLSINLSENLQRSSLNVVERAKAYRRLAQLESISHQQVAKRMHVSNATVSRELAILDLPEELQSRIATGRIPASLAYLLSRIDDPQAQSELAESIMAGRMNRQRLTDAVHDRNGKKNVRPKASRLSCRLEGGVSLTLTADQPLTRKAVEAAVNRLRQEAKKLPEQDTATTELAEAAVA